MFPKNQNSVDGKKQQDKDRSRLYQILEFLVNQKKKWQSEKNRSSISRRMCSEWTPDPIKMTILYL